MVLTLSFHFMCPQCSAIGYMESTMDATTSMTTPPEEVDNLMKVQYVYLLLFYW